MPLDYGRAETALPFDRVVLMGLSLVSAAVALGVLAITVKTWLDLWPDFGMTLLAVPAALVASAFGLVSFTAAKVAIGDA